MRKILKTKVLAIRVSPKMHKWVDEKASKRSLSCSEFLRWLLVSYMEQEGYKFDEEES